MEQNDPPICANCRHFRKRPFGAPSFVLDGCWAQGRYVFDPVYGKALPNSYQPRVARNDPNDKCGPAGKLFEPCEPKVTMMAAIWNLFRGVDRANDQ